ncbi:NAD(P)/FAD-dependent oxidoreductase [Roseibium limicola]|uniref:FAD-binding oxidoreductase n=1 Tax=Roseibium limicola TaxID=2816037 RepID=A0A939J7F4_9HYPH|nr:FAD-dependent oxidoreductase [Roseibium limicola]MBO0343749.1 FAD-binding oxidoreductase [Roseibium limicola]
MTVGEREDISIGSFWEASVGQIKEDRQLVGEAVFDVAVIGAGITGLSAALKLAEAGASVCVLEARRVGWGASGRNGGFCCFGGTKLSEQEMVRKFGEDEAKRFVAYQLEAIETVSDRLNRFGMDVDRHSSGEMILAHRPRDAAGFQDDADYLNKTFGLGVRVLGVDELNEEGICGPEFHGGMHMPHGFALNPMKYVQALAQAVRDAGGRIYSHTEVLGLAEERDEWRVSTRFGGVRATRVVLAGNGYSREQVPEWLGGRLMPVMSSVMVTRPMSDDELAAQGWTSDMMSADSRILLHYFRLMPDNRFLFGTRGGIFETPEAMKTMQKRGRADFERMFPSWADVETEHAWHGHVCLAKDLTAYVGPIPEMAGVFGAMAYHGSGVAMASLSGEKVADMILGKIRADDLPGVISKPFSKFPFPALRQLYLQGAYWYYGWKDR